MAMVALGSAVKKSRDTARIATLSQIGRVLASSGQCFRPAAGAGDYDISELVAEVRAANPQYASALNKIPRDPKSGTDAATNYRYAVNAEATACAIYANLEADQAVTLPSLTAPTAGGGTGILESSTTGPNGTKKYYQVSNK